MSLQPLQTRLKLLFGKAGVDATSDIMPDLLSFQYNDKESNEADELNITLKDETGKWAHSWNPDGGETVKAYITQGEVDKRGKTLYCGTFFVDNLSTSGGSGRTFTMRAISIPLNAPIRKRLKTKAWEGYTLQGIAAEIAKNAEIRLFWDVEDDIEYDRQDQSQESDLAFLSKLCEEAGLSIKMTDSSIVIFDQLSYEKKAPVKTFSIGDGVLIDWSFESSQSETYKSVTITYRDPKKNAYDKDMKKQQAVTTYTATDPEADTANGQEFHIKKRAKSLAEAERIAKNKLRSLNRRSVKGSINIIGDVEMVAGIVIRIKGIGSFDGNFIVENASHDYGTGGYKTSLSLRRVNNNY